MDLDDILMCGLRITKGWSDKHLIGQMFMESDVCLGIDFQVFIWGMLSNNCTACFLNHVFCYYEDFFNCRRSMLLYKGTNTQ